MACLLLGKASLPWLRTSGRTLGKSEEDGFRVEIPETDFPDSSRDIIQKYSPLPQIRFPVLNESTLEWVPVSFEISPFLIDGVYSGALIRYSARDGSILSPSPADWSMTLAFTTP